jgi:hypothetical protein
MKPTKEYTDDYKDRVIALLDGGSPLVQVAAYMNTNHAVIRDIINQTGYNYIRQTKARENALQAQELNREGHTVRAIAAKMKLTRFQILNLIKMEVEE